MAKVFYTDRDIEDLAKQGVDSIEVNDDVVLTDLALDKARRLGVALITERDKQRASAPAAPESKNKPTPAAKPAPEKDTEARIFSAVKARLGDQVDDALLRTIVSRVIRNISQR